MHCCAVKSVNSSRLQIDVICVSQPGERKVISARRILMKRTKTLLLLLLTWAGGSTLVFGQSNGDAAGAACSVLGCGVFGIIYLLIIAACLAIPITIDVFRSEEH